MASTEAEAEPGLRENNYNLFRQQTPYYNPYWRGGRALGFNQFPFDFQARLARPTAKPGNTISQSSQFNPSNQRREAFESIGPSLQSRRFSPSFNQQQPIAKALPDRSQSFE